MDFKFEAFGMKINVAISKDLAADQLLVKVISPIWNKTVTFKLSWAIDEIEKFLTWIKQK